jgi:2-(1,2-epoxy-1,2-dihydrophenyl)acetyl-CoA isomerase
LSQAKLTYSLHGAVAVLRFNDPDTLNAAGPDSISLLQEGLARAEREARCAMLTGSGRGFCSGANLASGRMTQDGEGFDAGAVLASHYNPLMLQIRDLGIPFLTAVNGVAAGVGCSLALMGDMIIACESAYFLQAFRRIGLVPDGGSTWLLARAIGRARAMEMMLLGEKVSAAQALQWGLINRLVPDPELESAAMALAAQLAAGPKALALIRKAAWNALDLPFEAQLGIEREVQRQAGRTEDFREGVTAFLQKRPAEFQGR